MYNFNWHNVIMDQIPPILRKQRRADWLHTAIKPLKTMYDEFLSWRKTTLFYLQFSYQVASLEYLLNDEYPSGNGGIYIEDFNTSFDYDLSFYFSENQPVELDFYFSELDPPAAYLPAGYESALNFYFSELFGNYDAIVFVPVFTTFTEQGMRNLIDQYKPFGTRYQIQTY